MAIHGLSVKKLKEKFNWLEVKGAAPVAWYNVSTGAEASATQPLPVQQTQSLIIMAHAALPLPRSSAAAAPRPSPPHCWQAASSMGQTRQFQRWAQHHPQGQYQQYRWCLLYWAPPPPVDPLPIKATFDGDPDKLLFFLNHVWAHLDCYIIVTLTTG